MSADIFRLAKHMKQYNQDVMWEKPVNTDAGQLPLEEEAKKKLEKSITSVHVYSTLSSR